MAIARSAGADTVNSIVRRQIENLAPSTPLIMAMKEWHAQADEETRRAIEAQVQVVMDTIRLHSSTGFGVGQALELLGALIAFDEGWRRRRCPEKGWKYERNQRKVQRRLQAE